MWMKLNGIDNLQLLYRNQIILDTKWKQKYQDDFSFINSKKVVMTFI